MLDVEGAFSISRMCEGYFTEFQIYTKSSTYEGHTVLSILDLEITWHCLRKPVMQNNNLVAHANQLR